MPLQTRRSLQGLLAIGPHRLDDQLRALTGYAARTGHALDALWTTLPGEDPSRMAPESGVPIVAFDDEIAGFTPEEYAAAAGADASAGEAVVDWHVAHARPQPKRPTTHLPVYARAAAWGTAADAVLCVESESLDRQLARMEAYAMRAGMRLRGVYVARDSGDLQLLLHDFAASNRALGREEATLTVGPGGEVEVHG